MKLEEAKRLRVGQVVFHHVYKNSDGSPMRWRVNGEVKIWKRDPDRIKVPLKHGLWDFGYLTNGTFEGKGMHFNVEDFCVNEDLRE